MIGKPKDQGARSTPVQHPLRRRLASGGQIPGGPVLWVRSRPAVAVRLWRRVVEEWLSRRWSRPWTAFPQVGSITGGASRLPVKPSAQPTLVRTQHLPPTVETAPDRWLDQRGRGYDRGPICPAVSGPEWPSTLVPENTRRSFAAGCAATTSTECSLRPVIDMSATAPPDAENMGVGAAQVEFSSWGWAFRSQYVKDYGIDAHAEPFDGPHQPSNELLALQIKSGDSYFREETDEGWWYWGENKHLQYWLSHVLPVLIIIYDPDGKTLY